MDYPTSFLLLPDHARAAAPLFKKLSLLALSQILSATVPSPSFRSLQKGLTGLAKSKNKAFLSALRRVDVLAPTLAWRSQMLSPADAIARIGPPLLLALWDTVGRSIPETILWDAAFDELLNPMTMQLLRFEPSARGLLLDPSGIEIRVGSGERVPLDGRMHGVTSEAALHTVQGRTHLAIHDTNPVSHIEAHPDKIGRDSGLSGHAVSEWCASIRDALALIELALPRLAQEIGNHLQRVVPSGFDAQRHFSASYREAPGLIYLSLHPSALTMAEAIIHETQHGKLNALRWFDPLFHNADETWTTSPIRPDIRPLSGVLMAVHAFAPVAVLHDRLRAIDHPSVANADGRIREVKTANAAAVRTLRQLGRPTDLGKRLLDDITALHDATTGGENLPEGDITALG